MEQLVRRECDPEVHVDVDSVRRAREASGSRVKVVEYRRPHRDDVPLGLSSSDVRLVRVDEQRVSDIEVIVEVHRDPDDVVRVRGAGNERSVDDGRVERELLDLRRRTAWGHCSTAVLVGGRKDPSVVSAGSAEEQGRIGGELPKVRRVGVPRVGRVRRLERVEIRLRQYGRVCEHENVREWQRTATAHGCRWKRGRREGGRDGGARLLQERERAHDLARGVRWTRAGLAVSERHGVRASELVVEG